MPAGTRNHFALDLGIDREDVPGALDAFDDGVDTRVDLAEINGRVFVNNASMGVYAKVVQSADYRDAKVQTASALLPDMLGPGAKPLDLHYTLPSGEEAVPGQLLLVSNNPYDLAHLRGGGTRERLDAGVLGVVSLRVGSAADAEKVAALEMTGQVQRFAGWNEWTASEFDVRLCRARGGRRRRRGPRPRSAAALRHPARRGHRPTSARGAATVARSPPGADHRQVDPRSRSGRPRPAPREGR